jgi:3-hydroxy acid dehydrogenase/malonic semialdehyde reductase
LIDNVGKTVLVTGASSGIGQAVARRFAASGARVIAAARRMDRLIQLKAELGPHCLPLQIDLTDTTASREAVLTLPEPFNCIDVLINAAGVALGDAPAQSADWCDWRQTIETNVLGLVAITHAVLPQMVTRQQGDIVNIGSIAASYPYPKGHVYAASKAFVHQFTLNLRADLAGLGVRAICIEPGTTVTDFAAVRLGFDQEKVAAIYGNRELLKPDDVAEVVLFAVNLPRHVNLNLVEMMATDQSFSFFRFADKH